MSLPRRRLFYFKSIYVHQTSNVILRSMCQSVSGNSMRFLNENPSSTLRDSFVQIVGNGARGISKGALLRMRDSRILFNCGENAEPFFKGIVSEVFVTHLDWVKIGGILALIYKASSSNRQQLSLCGPPGLDIFIRASERFCHVHNFKVNLLDCSAISQKAFSNFDIKCIPIRSKNKLSYKPPSIDKSWIKKPFIFKSIHHKLLDKAPAQNIDLNVSYSYICKTEKNRAWVLSECVRRGVKPGENMQKLWGGESVILEDGSVVQPEDVISTEPCPIIIVLDCPSEGFLDDLLEKQEYDGMFKTVPLIIIHFTPVSVMQDKRYISWIQRFPLQTKHVIVNESNEWTPPFKVSNRQEVCRLISPRFFPKLKIPKDYQNVDTGPHWVQYGDFFLEDKGMGVIVEEKCSGRWLNKWKDMPNDLKLVQTWAGTIVNLNDLKVLRAHESFVITQLPNTEETQYKKPPPFFFDNPRITFLGTCSQGCSAYRNTSAILVQSSLDKAMLLDCGDGTMHQLATLHDQLNLQRLLTSIRCIYISHTHADHHSGLVGVLRGITRAWELTGHRPHKVILLLPAPLLDWFETYHNQFQSILKHVIPIYLSDLIGQDASRRKEFSNLFRKLLDMKQIQVCWAVHSAFSHCVSFEHISGWKISYSGDSKYNEHFVRIGKNSDLLIHEATYASGLDRMANIAKHSTTEEAIRVGREMNAKQVILTHFSRRYPVIPILKDLRKTTNVSVAFDFLQVNLNDMHHLPKLNECYEAVFEQYLTEIEDEHARLLNRQLRSTENSLASEK